MEPRLEALEGLVRGLETLLGSLDTEDPGARSAALAWERCQADFERFRDLQSRHIGEALPDALRLRIEDALRLHAVAASTGQRAKLQVEDEMRYLEKTRDRLRAAGGPAPESRSCNVRG